MLQAVKTKINNLLSPILDRNKTETTEKGYNRKRKIAFDTDCSLTPSKKKQHQDDCNSSLSPPKLLQKWNHHLSNLYTYVRYGNVKMNEGVAHNKNKPMTSCSSSHEQTSNNRRTLSAVRRRESSRRVAFAQISNSSVLDLTNVDDNDDDLNEELKINKVKVDLTRFIPTRSSFKSSKTEKDKKDKHLEEIIRLDERKRYKELLAHFTAVTLPEYSESVSPSHLSVCATNIASPKRFETYPHQPISNSVNTLSFHSGMVKNKTKAILIDLTKKDYDESAKRREFHHDILEKSKTSPSILESSHSQTGNNASVYTSTAKTSPKPKNTMIDLTAVQIKKDSKDAIDNILLSSDWLKKWRETIDPLQLERERQIKEEEHKKEVIKSKQKAQFERIEREIEKSKVKEFPELTEAMLDKVKQALAPGKPNNVFVQGFNTEITRADISTLREATWLNDEVVNFYFNLLKERSEKSEELPKVHVFNTFFYPKIVKAGHAGVKRWTRKVDIFSFGLILIPVHLNMHWCLAVIDFQNKTISYYDSLKGNNLQCVSVLKDYLQDESRDKKKTVFDFTGWTELMPKDIPEQMNGCDCGVFMCKYAEYKSRNAAFTFAQKDMPYFRKRMIYEIISKKLM